MLEHSVDISKVEAGCDEAGRGCLAGPVVAAAVILPPGFFHPLLNDSKKMSRRQREVLRCVIEQEALAYQVQMVDNEEIDRINILKASFKAMHLCLDAMGIGFSHIAVDGNRFVPYKNIPHTCVVKGDGKYMNIAAASVLAKTYRDEFMEKIHTEFPQYAWNENKGYPTEMHRQAVIQLGRCKYHRFSFQLKESQVTLDL